MSLFELRKNLLAPLLLAALALLMLPACSSTDEGSSSTNGGSTSVEECVAACPEGDWNCKDRCTGVGEYQ
jgi:hypothetical protein